MRCRESTRKAVRHRQGDGKQLGNKVGDRTKSGRKRKETQLEGGPPGERWDVCGGGVRSCGGLRGTYTSPSGA